MSLGDIKELSLIIDTDDQRFDGQGIPDKAVTVKNGKAVVLLPPFSGRLYAVKSLYRCGITNSQNSYRYSAF